MTDPEPGDSITSRIVSAPSSPLHDVPTAELSNNPGNTSQPSQPQKRRQKCRFYASKTGCRAGDTCPFYHDATIQTSNARQRQPRHPENQLPSRSSASRSTAPSAEAEQSNSQVPSADDSDTRKYVPLVPNASRVVQRPIPRAQVEDPRAFQLVQIRRRFQPKETQSTDGTSLVLKLVPSDPDFPFEIAALDCTLFVPNSYPASKPSLKVTNKEMGRGYQINVETGFDAIVEGAPDGTLLRYLNALDKKLEDILAAPKADTIKLIANMNKSSAAPVIPQIVTKAEPETAQKSPPPFSKPKAPIYSADQLSNARSKREQDVRQLEARLGRLPQFSKTSDGLSFTLPVEPRKRNDLPMTLQAVRTVKLIVPALYNLEPCQIEAQGVYGEEVRALHEAFRLRALENPNLTLVSHINFLSQNMHIMATSTSQENSQGINPIIQVSPVIEGAPVAPTALIAEEDDRTHVITIPRPPEWSFGRRDSDTDDSDSCDSGDESDQENPSEHEDERATQSAGPERGIAVSLPFLELYGIELLELVSPSITIKCIRCKTQVDINNLKNNASGDASSIRSDSCRKCGLIFAIGYRMEMMHTNSVRAGYFDLDGCMVVDLLPSNFVPTCSECSTRYPSPGLVSVRGESSMANCRECHKQLSFRIPEVKFLQVSAAAVRASRALPRKKREQLGLTAGQELPRRGKCSHYAKSYRWFRFSCCSKVYPCDKCHDVENDHPNEHANRMICGFCSREQNYRPEDCGICHSILVGKKGSGFWEGGKGTRDKTRMSRKDPRKYKRAVGSKGKR